MTTQELIDYYADLLILQYKSKPKAYETIRALGELLVIGTLAQEIKDAFNIETATGVHLDLIGKYAGVGRQAITFSSQVTLSDDDYRQMIKMKIVQNNSESTLASIQELIQSFFPNSLRVFDDGTMRMSYYFNSQIGSELLAEAFVRQSVLPKPMGVELSSLIYVAEVNDLYGFRTYAKDNPGARGFNQYDGYNLDWPWLNYSNALSV